MRRTTHYIAVSDGQIELRFVGDQDTDPAHAFIDERAAAQALAQAIHRTGCMRILNSSSVNWPEEDGRPDFDYDAFLRRVRAHLSGLERADA